MTTASQDTAYTSPLRWIRLGQYCALSGDTPDAVHARRRKRQWVDGKHTKVDPGGNLWVNPDEVNKWVEGQEREQQQDQPDPAPRRPIARAA